MGFMPWVETTSCRSKDLEVSMAETVVYIVLSLCDFVGLLIPF